MKEASKRIPQIAALLTLLLLAPLSIQLRAQTPVNQNPVATQPTAQPPLQQLTLKQMLDRLNLTPDQIQRIRAINTDLGPERQAANQRFRQARMALTAAVEAPNPDEKLIDQRSRELGEAQAIQARLNSLAEARIRQVLTPEQLEQIRIMRAQRQEEIRQLRQQQRQEGQPVRPTGLGRPRTNLMPNPKRPKVEL